MLGVSRFFVVATMTVVLSHVLACSGSEGDGDSPGPVGGAGGAGGSEEPPGELGQYCARGRGCVEGLSCHAAGEFCTQSCSTDADCPDEAVCESIGGESVCKPRCLSLTSTTGFNCSVAVPCTSPDASCERCGCPAAEMCILNRCIVPAQLGEPCAADPDCVTGNCSAVARVCRVALGDFCDETNCDRCMVLEDWSSCSRSCSGFIDCGPNSECRGFEPNFYCYERCSDRTCPTECDEICDCPECEIRQPAGPAGQPCQQDQQCASGMCFGAPFGGVGQGTCADACAADGSCAAGFQCLDQRCLPTCEAGEVCRFNLATIQPLMCTNGVCDPRLANGGACTIDQECQSVHCMDGECRGASAIGESCASDGDCVEGFCCSGTCRSAC